MILDIGFLLVVPLAFSAGVALAGTDSNVRNATSHGLPRRIRFRGLVSLLFAVAC